MLTNRIAGEGRRTGAGASIREINHVQPGGGCDHALVGAGDDKNFKAGINGPLQCRLPPLQRVHVPLNNCLCCHNWYLPLIGHGSHFVASTAGEGRRLPLCYI